MGPSLLAPVGGWRAVHDGALRAPAAVLYTMGPFGPPLRVAQAPALAAGASLPKKKLFFWLPTKKKQKNKKKNQKKNCPKIKTILQYLSFVMGNSSHG